MTIREIDDELLLACSELDEKRVLAALTAGADPNCHDNFDYPLLACLHASDYDIKFFPEEYDNPSQEDDTENGILDAIYDEYELEADRRRIRIFDLLLEYGADLNADHGDLNPLMWETIYNNNSSRIIEYLLQKGANPNSKDWDFHITPLEHAWELERLIVQDDMRIADRIPDNARLLLAYGALPEAWEDIKENIVDLSQIQTSEDLSPDIEKLSTVFRQDYCRTMRDVDAALVFSCQRMDYHSFQVAAKLGGDLSIVDEYGRPLPVIVLQDVPLFCKKKFVPFGWYDLEDSIIDFLLFLLVGMKVPTNQEICRQIMDACAENEYDDTLQVLTTHHTLGRQFSAIGK